MLDVNKPIETFCGIPLAWDSGAVRREDGGDIEWINKYGEYQRFDLVFVSPGKEDLGWDSGRPPFRNRAEPANDELAELRAFKEAAIAKYPDLGPVDPDFAEAKNLMQGSGWGSGTECSSPGDPNFDGSVCDVVLKGIKRGRELERYAKGLTTPKD